MIKKSKWKRLNWDLAAIGLGSILIGISLILLTEPLGMFVTLGIAVSIITFLLFHKSPFGRDYESDSSYDFESPPQSPLRPSPHTPSPRDDLEADLDQSFDSIQFEKGPLGAPVGAITPAPMHASSGPFETVSLSQGEQS
jgi:hypothetical protein